MLLVPALLSVNMGGGVAGSPGVYSTRTICVWLCFQSLGWFNGRDFKMVQRRGLGSLLSVCEPHVAFATCSTCSRVQSDKECTEYCQQ